MIISVLTQDRNIQKVQKNAIFFGQKHNANVRGNPLSQDTNQHLKNS